MQVRAVREQAVQVHDVKDQAVQVQTAQGQAEKVQTVQVRAVGEQAVQTHDVQEQAVPAGSKAGRARGGPRTKGGLQPLMNALTVDVEEYFTIQSLAERVPRTHWDWQPSRVEEQTRTLLELFDARGVRATFFVLGWVAERHPRLIREIHERGHEVAAHSYWHEQVFQLTRESFREDLRRVRDLLEGIVGTRVIGYRAPTYSITRDSLWAHEILAEEGFSYSSSIFPILHDRYGIPDYGRHPVRLDTPAGPLWEFPLTTLAVLGTNLPVAGGGYMRLLPAWAIAWALRRTNERERQPGILYLHPWEIDPHIPRFSQGLLKDFRGYVGLATLKNKLDDLLKRLPFSTVAHVLGLDPEDDSHAEQT